MRHPSKSSNNWPSLSFKSYLFSCTEARPASCHMEWELAISKLRLPMELAKKQKIMGIQPPIPHIKAGAPIRNKERTRMPYWLAMNKAWWGLPLSGVPAKITMTKILVTSDGNAQKSCMILTCIQLSPDGRVVGKEFLYIKKKLPKLVWGKSFKYITHGHTQQTNFARASSARCSKGHADSGIPLSGSWSLHLRFHQDIGMGLVRSNKIFLPKVVYVFSPGG